VGHCPKLPCCNTASDGHNRNTSWEIERGNTLFYVPYQSKKRDFISNAFFFFREIEETFKLSHQIDVEKG
jgi:hypothetical protein